MRKYTHLDDEIEHYTEPDWTVFTITSIAALIAIALVLWTPDVEAIGTKLHTLIFGV